MPGLSTNTKLLIHANYGVAAPEYAHFKLNDNAGNTTVTDSGMGANTGTASTNTSNLTTTGKVNQAFVFNGTTEYVNIDALEVDIASDTKGSFSLWIYPTGTTAGRLFAITNSAADTTLHVSYNGGSDVFDFYLRNAGTDRWYGATAGSYPENNWYHLAVVQDGIRPKVYINGVDINLTLSVSTNPGYWLANLTGLNTGRIGCMNYNGGGNTVFYTGKIDDFRYYQNTALSQEAITAIYNAGSGTEKSLINDVSASAHTISSYGDIKIATAVPSPTDSKDASGGGNALFNGTSAYLSIPDSADWDMGSGNFTFEAWVYTPGIPDSNGEFILNQGDATQDALSFYILPTGKIYLSFNDGVQGSFRSTNDVIQFGKWQHIAVVRNGSSCLMYVDGTSIAVTQTTAFGTQAGVATALVIGTRWNNGSPHRYFNGYMDELRISKGIARYTSNFTPSTRFTSDSYTKLLLHFDTSVTTDSGNTGHTVTNNNVVWKAGSKWNSGALEFDGTGDYLSIPDSADWDDIKTIDYQVNLELAGANVEGLWSQDQDANNVVGGWYYNNSFYFRNHRNSGAYDVELVASVPGGVTAKQWYHVALIRNNGFTGLYVNGTQRAFSYDPTYGTFSAPFQVGKYVSASVHTEYYHQGNLDEFRVHNSNYFLAAPNSFPAAPLLIYGEGVDEATTVANNGYSGAVTMSGGAKLDNGQKKFNATTSLFFDGSNDYLTVVDTSGTDYDIIGSATDSWTIDLWVKHTDHTGTEIYLNQGYDGDFNDSWFIAHTDGSGIRFVARSGGVDIINTGFGGEITNTSWHHVALVKSADKYGVYLDGTQVNYTQDASTATYTASLEVGGQSSFFDGYMEQVQITKGNKFGVVPDVGLTSTITVPTAVLTQNTITEPSEEYARRVIGNQAVLIA